MNKALLKNVLKPLRTLKLIVLASAIAYLSVSLLIPLLIGELIDKLGTPFNEILMTSFIIGIVVLGSFILNWCQNFLWFKLVHQATGRLRSYLFELVQTNDFSFFHTREVGDVVNIILNDSSVYAQYLTINQLMIIVNGFKLIAVLAIMTHMNLTIGIAVTLMTLIYFLSYSRLNDKMRQNALKERESFSIVLNKVTEFLRGNETIRMYQGEKYFSAKMNKTIDTNVRKLVTQQKITSFGQSLAELTMDIIPICAIILGGWMFEKGLLTIGEIVSIYAFVPYLAEPVQNLTNVNIAIQGARAVESRLFGLIPKMNSSTDSIEIDKIEQISFENISLAFDGKILYNDFSLELTSGDILLIKGPSGSGKSSLVSMIIGKITPDSGVIKVNSIDRNILSEKKLLERISISFQDVFLFSGKVEENIIFGKKFNEDKLRKAKEISRIETLEQKEKNDSYSGGEKQRIGLARTLYESMDLLIFDEPTSSLDKNTEKNFSETLINSGILRDKISIIITHGEAFANSATKRLINSNGTWKLIEKEDKNGVTN